MKLCAPLCTALLLAASVTACSDSPTYRTAPFAPTAVARISGQVLSASGAPLDSVWVAADFQSTIDAAYGSAFARTNRNGEFVINVQRVRGHGVAQGPDTVRVQVIAQLVKGAKSPYPEVRTSRLVTFGPVEPPLGPKLELRIQVP